MAERGDHGAFGHAQPSTRPHQLSLRRAYVVRNFLVQYGVAPDRLTARGYGSAQPIAGNDTAEGREMNRRVELRIVSGN